MLKFKEAMYCALRCLFTSQTQLLKAHSAYDALVKQARQPAFYNQYGIPDSIDGRFEMILLHLFLALRRLKSIGTKEAASFSRLLSEAFFTDMDRSVREIGVSDTGVPKRIKRMAAAYFGRLQAYEEAFADTDALHQALRRNAYATLPEADTAALDAKVAQLASYLRRAEEALRVQEDAVLLAGDLRWPDA